MQLANQLPNNQNTSKRLTEIRIKSLITKRTIMITKTIVEEIIDVIITRMVIITEITKEIINETMKGTIKETMKETMREPMIIVEDRIHLVRKKMIVILDDLSFTKY